MDEQFAAAIERWEADEGEAWEICCRKMQVCLMRGSVPFAKNCIDEFVLGMKERFEPVQHDTHVQVVFDTRTANALERAGYDSFGSVVAATDDELMQIQGFREVVIKEIREAIRLANQPRTRNYQAIEQLLNEATAKEVRYIPMSDMDRLNAAIDLLANENDQAISEVDARIGKLESEIEKLKRVRSMLAGPRGRKSQRKFELNDERQAIVDRIKAAIEKHGPMTSQALAIEVSKKGSKVSHMTVGKIVSASDELARDGKMVTLA